MLPSTPNLHRLPPPSSPSLPFHSFSPPATVRRVKLSGGVWRLAFPSQIAAVKCMASQRRVKMVAKQIMRELSDMLLTDNVLQHAVLPEASLGADGYLSSLTTISDVEVSGDLQAQASATRDSFREDNNQSSSTVISNKSLLSPTNHVPCGQDNLKDSEEEVQPAQHALQHTNNREDLILRNTLVVHQEKSPLFTDNKHVSSQDDVIETQTNDTPNKASGKDKDSLRSAHHREEYNNNSKNVIPIYIRNGSTKLFCSSQENTISEDSSKMKKSNKAYNFVSDREDIIKPSSHVIPFITDKQINNKTNF